MRIRWVGWTVLLGAAVSLIVLGARVLVSPSAPQFPAAGLTAPAFTLPDARDSSQLLSLQSFRGRPMILTFYASWCADCLNELQELQQVHEAFGDRLGILAVDVEELASNALHGLTETGLLGWPEPPAILRERLRCLAGGPYALRLPVSTIAVMRPKTT